MKKKSSPKKDYLFKVSSVYEFSSNYCPDSWNVIELVKESKQVSKRTYQQELWHIIAAFANEEHAEKYCEEIMLEFPNKKVMAVHIKSGTFTFLDGSKAKNGFRHGFDALRNKFSKDFGAIFEDAYIYDDPQELIPCDKCNIPFPISSNNCTNLGCGYNYYFKKFPCRSCHSYFDIINNGLCSNCNPLTKI